MKNFRARLKALQEKLGIDPGLEPPNFDVIYEARELDDEGAQRGAWLEPRFAQLDSHTGPIIERGPDESLEEFKSRVGKLPRKCRPSIRSFFHDRPENPPAA
jgi:hypothetical protein